MAKHRRKKPGPPRLPESERALEPVRDETVATGEAAETLPPMGFESAEPPAAEPEDMEVERDERRGSLDPAASDDYPERDYEDDVDPGHVRKQ